MPSFSDIVVEPMPSAAEDIVDAGVGEFVDEEVAGAIAERAQRKPM
jgi:hypothetical protein